MTTSVRISNESGGEREEEEKKMPFIEATHAGVNILLK
jgi:hypothetical protein